MEILIEISKHIEAGDNEKVYELTKDAIGKEIAPKQILNDGLISGMNVVGEKFRKYEIFLPDVLLAAKAMYAGMELLKPHFIKHGIPTPGKIVIGTVKGDLHDLGKNLVGIMLKGAGFEVIDLGKDVSPAKFIETAIDKEAQLIGMSALLTTTMPIMQEVIDLLKQKNLNGKIKTIIGGAPVTKEYAEKIGADAFAFDASNSVIVAKELIREK
jgi:5-methyltetrahydrofolate--homocysteine methyltransferase